MSSSNVKKLVILTTQKILQLDEFDDEVMPIYENSFNSDPGWFIKNVQNLILNHISLSLSLSDIKELMYCRKNFHVVAYSSSN